MRWIATLVVLTLISASAGGLSGLHVLLTAERVIDAQKNAGARPIASSFTGSSRLRKLSTVVTNLASPPGIWARVEASIVADNLGEEEASVLAARIGEDIVAYLRSTSLTQIEGARGLQYLREDLNERAAVRSEGRVRELIIETLVVQ